MACRRGSMPGVGAYFVLPAFTAAMHASLICSGVSKSGSPAAKLHTSCPAACNALALASTASVGDGEMFLAQVESGGSGELMKNVTKKKRRARTQANALSADEQLE